jgi:hypothetical protein
MFQVPELTICDAGTYAMKIKVLGKPVIILNPFHAYQLGE